MKTQDQHQIKPDTQSCQMAVSGSVKASELRIGNFVNVPREDQSPFRIDAFECLSKKFIKVAMIHPEYGEKFHPLTWYGEDLKPIPLTEEWLLKFGFNCINRPKMAFKLYHNEVNADFSSMILKEVGNNPIWVYAGNNRWTINPFTVEIKYVNQLQNIYFALTGSDLQDGSLTDR